MIPIPLVVLFLVWADVMWIIYQRRRLPFDARPLVMALGCEAFLYVIFYWYEVPIDVRSDLVRVSLIVLSFSMALPLTIALVVAIQRNRLHG